MKFVKVLLGVFSLLAVLTIAFWESESLTSPGELHPTHAHVSELQGSAGCVKCHGDTEVSMANACASCHQPIREQLAQSSGIHGLLQGAVADNCQSCHAEHTSGAVALVSDRSFQAAQVEGVDEYDHRHVAKFDLVGHHDDLACESCHPNAHRDVLRKGELRYLGLDVACASCHDDPHKGEYGNGCAACHGQVHPFDQVAEFKHDDAFPLTGGHAKRGCLSCHEEHTEFAIPVLLAADKGPKNKPAPKVVERTCIDCHETPHRESFVTLSSKLAKVATKDTCALCHSAEHETFVGPKVAMTPRLHGASGFSLNKPHEKVECSKCHKEFGKREALAEGPRLATEFAALFPGRAQTDCQSCHTDPHRGQFDKGFSKGRCIDCHHQTHFKPANFTFAQHSRSHFPLTGSHQAVACDKCHQVKNKTRQFVPTATDCASCHEDVHRGRFDGKDKPSAVRGQKGCARCHDTKSFDHVTWSPSDHKLWTGWSLKGSHAKAKCSDCHKPRTRPDKDGRIYEFRRRKSK